MHRFHEAGLFSNYNKLLGSLIHGNLRLKDVRPKGEWRDVYATDLAYTAIDFFLYHELAHILNGHCGFAGARGMTMISEFETRAAPAAALDPIVRQGLEMDADHFATRMLCEHRLFQANDFDLEGRSRAERPGTPFKSPRQAYAFDCLFAVYAMFWLFGNHVLPELIERETHPPVPLRVASFLPAITTYVNARAPKFLEHFLEVKFASGGLVLDAVRKISGGRLPATFTKTARWVHDGRMIEHWRCVGRRWMEVRPEVLKHAHDDHLITWRDDPGHTSEWDALEKEVYSRVP